MQLSLNEGNLAPKNLARTALIALLTSCQVASGTTDANSSGALIASDVPSPVPEMYKDQEPTISTPEMGRCIQVQHLDCNATACQLKTGYVAISRDVYASLRFHRYDDHTVPCYQDGTLWTTEDEPLLPPPFSSVSPFLATNLFSFNFAPHPQLVSMLNNTMFTYLPEAKDVGGCWYNVNGNDFRYLSQNKRTYQFSTLVNIDATLPLNSGEQSETFFPSNTVLHELGHGIYETILTDEERIAFTDLVTELFDMVQINRSREAMLVGDSELATSRLQLYLARSPSNRISASSAPPFRKTAEDLYHEQLAQQRGIVRSADSTISSESIAVNKLEAMRLVMILATTLNYNMNASAYNYLGNGRVRVERYIQQEAYSVLLSYGGIMCDLFAPFFKPYLNEQGWNSRQYIPLTGGVSVNNNAFLFTAEGRRTLAREFESFWRYIESNPSIGVPNE